MGENQMRKRQRSFAFDDGEESLTKQSFADQSNANWIVAQYRRTGVATHITAGESVYGDFDQAETLMGAYEKVQAAGDLFRGLSSRIRDAAGNDPLVFATMLETEQGRKALEVGGLRFFEEGEGPDPEIEEDRIAGGLRDTPPAPKESVSLPVEANPAIPQGNTD